MDVLKSSDNKIINFLGGLQPIKKVSYRHLSYLIKIENKDATIIYNNLTSCCVALSKDELENFSNCTTEEDYMRFLIKHYFLVPEDFDERKIVDDFRGKEREKIRSNYHKKISSYTILTTTACNARCFYCFENGKKTEPMTFEMADKVIAYIEKNYQENKKKVSIGWFGGEPLFNMGIIDHICSTLTKDKIPYTSGIITNGYLVDEEVARKMKNDWKIGNVQITLDGTEDVYNKTKNYIYKDNISPFKKVLNSIRALLNEKIRVNVRLNLDENNADNLKELIEQLYKEFGNKNFWIYAHVIFEYEDQPETLRSDEQRALVYQKLQEVEEVLENFGYKDNRGWKYLKKVHCMADGGGEVLITPDGKFGVCEHFTDSDFWGDIDHPDIEHDEYIDGWMELVKTERCVSCPAYPSCVRIKKCVDEIICRKETQELEIRNLRRNIKNMVKEVYKRNVEGPTMEQFNRALSRITFLEKEFGKIKKKDEEEQDNTY